MATGSGSGKTERSATKQVAKDGNWFWKWENGAKCYEAGCQGWQLVLGTEKLRSATKQTAKDGNWFWVRKNGAKCDEAGCQGWQLVLGSEK